MSLSACHGSPTRVVAHEKETKSEVAQGLVCKELAAERETDTCLHVNADTENTDDWLGYNRRAFLLCSMQPP